jgi:hypothetical protein
VKILKFWTLYICFPFNFRILNFFLKIFKFYEILWKLKFLKFLENFEIIKESNVFRYNKILIDCVFGNSKFLVPSTLTSDLGFASVNSQTINLLFPHTQSISIYYISQVNNMFTFRRSMIRLYFVLLYLTKFLGQSIKFIAEVTSQGRGDKKLAIPEYTVYKYFIIPKNIRLVVEWSPQNDKDQYNHASFGSILHYESEYFLMDICFSSATGLENSLIFIRNIGTSSSINENSIKKNSKFIKI